MERARSHPIRTESEACLAVSKETETSVTQEPRFSHSPNDLGSQFSSEPLIGSHQTNTLISTLCNRKQNPNKMSQTFDSLNCELRTRCCFKIEVIYWTRIENLDSYHF